MKDEKGETHSFFILSFIDKMKGGASPFILSRVERTDLALFILSFVDEMERAGLFLFILSMKDKMKRGGASLFLLSFIDRMKRGGLFILS